jgi:hypothetical protein
MKWEKRSSLLDVLGLEEPPLAIFYSDTRPEKGFSPKPAPLPTREKDSFLQTETWRLVQKKIEHSKQAWDKKAGE